MFGRGRRMRATSAGLDRAREDALGMSFMPASTEALKTAIPAARGRSCLLGQLTESP